MLGEYFGEFILNEVRGSGQAVSQMQGRVTLHLLGVAKIFHYEFVDSA